MFVFADAYALFGATPGAFLIPVQAFLVIGTAYEMIAMFQAKHAISKRACLLSTIAAFGSCLVPILYPLISGKAYPANCPIGMAGWAAVGFVLAIFILSIDAMSHYRATTQDITQRFALGLLVVGYCVGLSHFLVCIRMSTADYSGLIAMVGFAMTVKMSDAGAYFTGRAFGKRPLDPIISPKKTVEGAVGGALASAIVASIFFLYAKENIFHCPPDTNSIPWWGPMVAGTLIAIAGLIGDLLESVIKRSCGVKDSGSLLPGLGGVWDVTDSLFFAAPVGYAAILAGLI
jgi:phosphatidate cytidylyltransferase